MPTADLWTARVGVDKPRVLDVGGPRYRLRVETDILGLPYERQTIDLGSDDEGPVVATLAPGLPIQVSEVRGAWARVICSNGWTGWIDGRIIGVAA